MNLTRTALADVVIVTPRSFEDARGAFSETYSKRWFDEAVASVDFIQDNQSLSKQRGTVRGLHFQRPPMAQAKLVRVLRGSILDVALDLRRSSETYLQHVAVELSAANGNQLYVPTGFAHGFCTLEDDTEVAYKVTEFYSPEHDAGLAWDDPALGIKWPVSKAGAIISEKDARLPKLSALQPPF